jgi:hypothetical protein
MKSKFAFHYGNKKRNRFMIQINAIANFPKVLYELIIEEKPEYPPT